MGNIFPSDRTLKNVLRELGVDIIMLTSEEIKDKDLVLICDKGED